MDEQCRWIRARRKRHILSAILCLFVLLNYIAANGIALPEKIVSQTKTADSRAKTAGGKAAEASWADSSRQILGQGSFLDATANVPANGFIILSGDISVTDDIIISKQITITSEDSLNPCMIKNITPDTDDREDRGRIFTVNSGTLRLSNVILDGGMNEGVVAYHPLICINSNSVGAELENGAVLQNAENASQVLGGGAISIRFGQVNMHSGAVITNCKAYSGGGIEINSRRAWNSAVFIMNGGSISGCNAKNGGGVYVNIGMFQLLGGEIINNRAAGEDREGEAVNYGGGGIYISGAANIAGVLIRGGKIADNEASENGGGVLLGGANALLQMMGGTLEGNKGENGGGISVLRGNLKLFGGSVTGNTAILYGGGILGCPYGLIELQGNPEVYGNTSGDSSDRFDNLYLDGEEKDGDKTLPIALTGELTDGVKLGMSRWISPDDNEHPYREMIVSAKDMPQSSGSYTITESDFNRLAQTLDEENKQLYADNMEKYALVQYEGKIVMILSTDIKLDKEKMPLATAGEKGVLTATVTPLNTPIKGAAWSSSDEAVAKVDENGNVTAMGEGEAVITATTKSPYHNKAECRVKVAEFRQLDTRAEHGSITYKPEGPFQENDVISIRAVPDKGYRFKKETLKALNWGDESVEIVISGETLNIPDYDVTVTAIFEPINYPIKYEMEGGTLQTGESNPPEYTIESSDIILKNPVKNGYTFKGWTGTGLTEAAASVIIPAGSTGERSYTAVWEEQETESSDTGPTEEESSDTKPSDEETESSNTRPTDEETESSDTRPTDEETESSDIKPTDEETESSDIKPADKETEGKDTSASDEETGGKDTKPSDEETENRDTSPTDEETESKDIKPAEGETEAADTKPPMGETNQGLDDTDTGSENPDTSDSMSVWYILAAVSLTGLLLMGLSEILPEKYKFW